MKLILIISLFSNNDHIDNVWMIDAIPGLLIMVACGFFFIRFLYAFIMGYRKTHKHKPVIENGIHQQFEDGKYMYDNPDKSWGEWTVKIIDNGVAFFIFLVLGGIFFIMIVSKGSNP